MNLLVDNYVLLGYGAMSLSSWFSTFRSKEILWERRGQIFY
jgi:hypothetical protein